jgi:hypothetical protein
MIPPELESVLPKWSSLAFVFVGGFPLLPVPAMARDGVWSIGSAGAVHLVPGAWCIVTGAWCLACGCAGSGRVEP